ncbi:hypothetical protein cce_4824 [Crocosphaera subtropica ATCC 51142]|uniref:Nickel/cobalt efflux system n=1 Tax=Crocosphaera subtropica (strain ATCC 51142 / BH68) TaxID=43989 RepID=B1X211_CROS5|nr:nickel transporter [Crocosphaera subtropica]ACB54172.1 hypothetical protein cce_4824 [Crocosphaera subtropica ATCC 51142]
MVKTGKKMLILAVLTCLISLGWSIFRIQPLHGHGTDLAVAHINVEPLMTRITLAIPSNLLDFADTNHDFQLSTAEITDNQQQLQNFFTSHLRLNDSHGHSATLKVEATDQQLLPGNFPGQNTHSTLGLTYTWLHPVDKIKIDYELLDNSPNARCLTTIFRNGQKVNYLFTPYQPTLEIDLLNTPPYLGTGSLVALFGAFVWGAAHALSPGHGKTLVGAYLVGTKAKAKHALFLALTTTVTHTIGVLMLGFLILVASQYFLPTVFIPWLSLLSGLMVVALGFQLLKKRLLLYQTTSFHTHDHSHHTHNHDHVHHAHDHSHHTHSHLPVDGDTDSISWGSLLTLGIAGGLVPCPSALVLLFSTVALGQIGWGILLVLIFCLGLAGTLTALGLLLINTKSLFERLPHQIKMTKILSIVSAMIVFIVGWVLTYQAGMDLLLPSVRL